MTKGYVNEDYEVDRPHPDGSWLWGVMGRRHGTSGGTGVSGAQYKARD